MSRIADHAMVLLLLLLALGQAVGIRAIGNGLAKDVDPFSEANAFRAAEHYDRFGFLVDAGLPHITYGEQFPNDGWVEHQRRMPDLMALPDGVYTRYPPLPDLICGVFQRLLGPGVRWLWRLIVATAGLATLGLAYLVLRDVLGAPGAALLLGMMACAPVTYLGLHSLHFEGYANELLILQLAVLVRAIARPPVTTRTLVALGMLGFAQGWLSFEYAFVVGGAVLPMALAWRCFGDLPDRRTLARLVIAPSLGFVAAHVLHLLQVAAFYGTMSTALADFGQRAAYRSIGVSGDSRLSMTWTAVSQFTTDLLLLPRPFLFGGMLLLALVLALTLLRLNNGSTGTVRRSGQWAIAGAFGLAVVWVLIMPAHGIEHPHTVSRLGLLPYFVCVLVVVLVMEEWFRPSTGE